ncbi:MAG: hypothetical protein IJA82_07265 [Clostridia bacterium]|nr:hypothetical protein [Clostridia bacterium]
MFSVYYNPKRERFEYRKGNYEGTLEFAIRQLRFGSVRFYVSDDKWFDLELTNENISSAMLMKPQFLPPRGGLLFFFLKSNEYNDSFFELDGKRYTTVIEIPKKIYSSWADDIEKIMKELDLKFTPPIL